MSLRQMSKPKYNIKKLEHMSEILKAVAHPLRISIIDLLIQSNELTVTQLHSVLKIQQPETSRQLQILKNVGLVNCRKEGNSRYYYLTDKNILNLLNCVENCTG